MLQRVNTRLNVQVYEHVKQLLLDGKLPLEEAIPVDAIIADLGVSRQPVMDAIKRLAQEGFVNVIPQVGSFPRKQDIKEILDFFAFFAEAECVIARLACERAEPAEIARLKSVSHEIGRLRSQSFDDLELARQYRSLNRRFHSEMRAMTKSAAVSEIVERMGDQSDFYIALSHARIFMRRLKEAHKEHEAIIAAIEARDCDRAMSIMKHHVLAVSERIAAQNKR
jgi:DNA-binding GntR family transcriptional regulator